MLIIVLAASGFSIANQFWTSKKAARAALKGYARTIQIAAESYATDSGGAYGSLESITPYLPGGSNTIDGPRQAVPAYISQLRHLDVDKIRTGEVPDSLVPNHIYYSVSDGGNCYTIFVSDEQGSILRGVGGKALELGNQ